MIVWAESSAGASVVKTRTQPAKKESSPRSVCLFYAPQAFVPGTIGVLTLAIGMEPARTSCWPPAAWRITTSVRSVRLLAFQGGVSANGACRGAQDHAKGIEPYDELGPLLDRHTHALALA